MLGKATRVGLGTAAAAAALCVLAPVASADLTTLLAATSCTQKDAADGSTSNGIDLPFFLCDDGQPPAPFGGRTPNPTAVNAVEVPAAYNGFAGLPAKTANANQQGGADTEGNIALDVDVSLPDPTHFGANKPADDQYPIVVFMHGCCAGYKGDWEASTVDAGGERWKYNNAWFASRGYVVVNYTARGFVRGHGTPQQTDDNGSTGETHIDHRSFEINDFQHLVGQLVDKGDLHPGATKVVKVDPDRVVSTGGSYGGGFSWMALTDPVWNSPGGTSIKLVASAPKYGWTDLVQSLVPNGTDLRDQLRSTDPNDTGDPLGFPKQSIVAGLYASGKTGTPSTTPGEGFNHATFPQYVDEAFVCTQSGDPFETNPLCASTLANLLPSFANDRSAYYQNDFFDGLESGAIDPVPLFSMGTFTDTLFPPPEHRRMVERLKATVSDYPVQEYYGDYQHFTQNKEKEWGDVCGDDRHVCRYEDYPAASPANLDADPATLKRTGINTRLNRFLDHYVKPPANTGQAAPALDVTASLMICPDNASTAFPADEPGQRFTEATFDALAPNNLRVQAAGEQRTTNKALPNQHAVAAEPIFNERTNEKHCPVEDAPGGQASAGPGVATYDSAPLPKDFTMIGRTRVRVPHTGSGDGLQLNARLYDLFPEGKEVMVDRGVRRLTNANETTIFDLHGQGWRFPKGHRIRIELAQDNSPYIRFSNQPSSLTLAGVRLDIPVREASASVGGRVPPSSTGGPRAGPAQEEPVDEGGEGGGGAESLPVGGVETGRTEPPAGDGALPLSGLGLIGLLAAGALLLASGAAVRRLRGLAR